MEIYKEFLRNIIGIFKEKKHLKIGIQNVGDYRNDEVEQLQSLIKSDSLNISGVMNKMQWLEYFE